MSSQSKCYKCGGDKASAVEYPMRRVFYDHTSDECFLVAIQRIEALEAKLEILAVHRHHISGTITDQPVVIHDTI